MKSVRECEVVYRRRAVDVPSGPMLSSETVYTLMRAYVDRAHESVWAVLLDARQRVIATHECARGNTASAAVQLSTLFRAAIVVGAVGVILVHNHPSGDPHPSPDDLTFTTRATQAGKLLDVAVLDHVIIADSGYFSLLDAGHMGGR